MLTWKFFYGIFSICFLMVLKTEDSIAQEAVDTVRYEMKDTVLARELLEEGIELLKENKYEIAIEKLYSSEKIYLKNGEKVNMELAEIHFQIGRAFTLSGKYDLALEAYSKSLNEKVKLFGMDHPEIAFLYNNIGNVYFYKSEFNNAFNYFEKALYLRLKLFGENNQDVASTYLSLGAYYFTIEDYDKAFVFYKRAQIIWIRTLGGKHRYVAMACNNLGNVFKIKNDNNRAIEYFKKAIITWQSTSGLNDPDIALSYYNIGNLFEEKGEYDKAIEYHNLALDIRLKIFGEEHPETANSYNELGSAYKAKNDYKKALQYFEKAKDINLKVLGDKHPSMAYFYEVIGSMQKNEGNYNSSLENYKKSLLIKLNTYGQEHSMTSNVLHSIGLVYNKMGKYNQANKYLKNALDIQMNLKRIDNTAVSALYYSMAEIHLNQLYFVKAEEDLNQSLRKLNYLKGKIPDNNIFIQQLIYTLNLKATLYMRWYKIDHSIHLLRKSMENHFESLAALDYYIKNLSPSAHITFAQLAHNIYEEAIITNQLLFKETDSISFIKQSYDFSEHSKSLILYRSIQETNALQFAGIPDSLLDKEYDLRIDMTYYDKKRQEKLSEGLEETDTIVLAISSKLFGLKREYEALKERFEKDYPDYYRLKYDVSTTNLSYIQDTLLTPYQTLLEYFVGDSSIFIFTIGKDLYDVVEVKKDFPLEDWVKQLQNGLFGYYSKKPIERTDDLYRTTLNDYHSAAQKLYEKLIAPIKEKLNTQELIIVPDGVLGYVPFGALLSGGPERANNFKTYPFLEKDYKISYCYSATLLREMKEKRHKQQPTGALVAFAPFYEGSYAKLDSTFSLSFDTLANGRDTLIFNDIVTRKDFNKLPASGEEVKAASLFWDGDYFLNNDATEDRFNEVAGNYRIVHLSTHGVADNRVGDYSYLAFAEQKDSIENELLYVRDLYNLQLNADLVTLSACETAAGELQRGEGIISLARAFAYAGAKSIITTLWVADDAATKDLMKVFYQHLKKGETKDGALQQAKKSLLESRGHAHPFFWAGFVPVGDMSAME